MPRQKKDLIVNSFQKMDLDMLEVLLDNTRTYQEATKEVFLKKIGEVFQKMKSSGDTELKAYAGVCDGEMCGHEAGKGYSFMGNKSGKHLNLIFEETETDFTNIYHCWFLKTSENPEGDSADSIRISFSLDERADFEPGIDFSIKNQNAQKAIEDLMQYKGQIIDQSIIKNWLEKFRQLRDTFDFHAINYSKPGEFYTLFIYFKRLSEYVSNDAFAKIAANEFPASGSLNEPELLKWLVNHEQLGRKLVNYISEDIDFEQVQKDNFFEVGELKIGTDGLINSIRFKCLFDKYYWDRIEKYIVPLDEGFDDREDNMEHLDEFLSLSYRLKELGILQKL